MDGQDPGRRLGPHRPGRPVLDVREDLRLIFFENSREIRTCGFDIGEPVGVTFPDTEKPKRMSDNENINPRKQTSSIPLKSETVRVTLKASDENPSKQTSSVPLKKETVRVTLKASDAPPALPSATLPSNPAPTIKPPSPPIAPPKPTGVLPPSGAPTAPRPPAPAPTIPLRTAGPPTTAGAPTIRLATSNSPVGAPTIALKTANAPLTGAGAPTIALKTANAPLPGGGPSTVALPKATVALNPPTKPLSPTSVAATQKPTLSTAEETEDETGAGTFSKILAGVGLVAALLVLGIQLKMSNIWIGVEDNERAGDWSLLLE
jgi:hypothetical protein